ncbi:MAG: C4-dicarboxylic acid transporter DauA [Planctomycetia bacterium]|nr:MAG: C4-dicarboxylic acid transporter DauA [Planctomycetia bacterium]
MPLKFDPPQRQSAVRPAIALRTALGRYGVSDLRSDVLAGLVVGVVALPLSMALAIASGVPPQFGLYTAIVAGAVTALLGGSMRQVSGPTAAFVVLLVPVTQQFGPGGLMLATLLAGIILVGMALARLGRLILFIPFPVTTGFTTGIAIVIASMQLKDFFGLPIARMDEHFIARLGQIGSALGQLSWPDFAVGVLTLGLLTVLPRVVRSVPAPLLALPAAALVGWGLQQAGLPVHTIHSRFGGVPQALPSVMWPWQAPGADGAPLGMSFELLRALIGPAFAIAMLGAIESLLSAVVADGITGDEHDPDTELFAQGVGNIAAPFFGGFAATGAIARTATNIRAGARSPVAAVVHALFILIAILALAPALGYLPMAGLAAMLLITARNMAELRHVVHTLRVAPRGDTLVLLLCITLTVLFDMVVSVSVGVVLAALLFMGRMADLARAEEVLGGHPHLREPLPPGVLLYQIAGPLFFGAARKAVGALRVIQDGVRIVILDMTAVPMMDATGLVNLESTMDRLHNDGVYVVIAGIQAQPHALMVRAGWRNRGWLTIYRNFEDAVVFTRTLAASDLEHRPAAN